MKTSIVKTTFLAIITIFISSLSLIFPIMVSFIWNAVTTSQYQPENGGRIEFYASYVFALIISGLIPLPIFCFWVSLLVDRQKSSAYAWYKTFLTKRLVSNND